VGLADRARPTTIVRSAAAMAVSASAASFDRTGAIQDGRAVAQIFEAGDVQFGGMAARARFWARVADRGAASDAALARIAPAENNMASSAWSCRRRTVLSRRPRARSPPFLRHGLVLHTRREGRGRSCRARKSTAPSGPFRGPGRSIVRAWARARNSAPADGAGRIGALTQAVRIFIIW